jgi:hypothetical protein
VLKAAHAGQSPDRQARDRALATLAASAILAIARRLAIGDDADLRTRFAAAAHEAPGAVLAAAFERARAATIGRHLRSVIASPEQA